MLELRRNAAGVLAGLRRGEAYTLTFRRKPVGELRPIISSAALLTEDPAYRLADRAEDLRVSLSAAEADALLYDG